MNKYVCNLLLFKKINEKLNKMTQLEFESKLTLMYTPLRMFSFKFAYSEEDANELVQETMMRALINREKYREDVNFKAWLFRMMKNIFINQYKRNKRLSFDLDANDSDEGFVIQIEDNNQPSPEQVFCENEIQDEVNKLSVDLREPFEMHVKGFKYKEIAEKLSLPLGTIKSKIFLARKRLSGNLPGYR